MRYVTSFFLTFALAAVASPETKIKIDTVPAEYKPTSSPGLPEPVSIERFYFEVNKEMTRARIAVQYTYSGQPQYGLDGGVGPPPTLAQLAGLIYDPSAQAVVYDRDGKKTVCAVVQERKGHFGRRLNIRNTGSCVVTATVADHAEDDGWTIQRFRAIDTYFEVH